MEIYLKKAKASGYFFVILALVKRLSTIQILLTLVLLTFPLPVLAANEKTDSEILQRMFEFQEHYTPTVKGKTTQVYTKHYYQTFRRNAGLWLIPSMYTIARGKRKFLSEEYSKITIEDVNTYKQQRQVFYTTIPRNRTTMSILEDFKVPNLYNTTLFGKHLLSPFVRENSIYYKYKVSIREGGHTRITFLPRVGDNTQLVSGTVIIETKTGRILDAMINGEYDMIKFNTTIKQNKEQNDSLGMPRYCKTDIDFKFLGNHIVSSSMIVFNCDSILPDSVNIIGDHEVMTKLRPVPLTKREMEVIEQEMSDTITDRSKEETQNELEESEKSDNIVENGWDALKDFGYDVGTYLVRSHGTENKNYRIKFSPVLQPQYLSYSKSRGLSYKMKFSFDYDLRKNQELSLNTTIGYNFKIKKLYAHVPLKYVYNKKRNHYLELTWDAGNRIGNSSIIDELKEELGTLPELDSIKIDEFNDSQISLKNYTQLSPKIRLELGCVYHERTAVNKYDLLKYGKPTRYRTLASLVGVQFKIWNKGPMFSLNYENTINNRFSDLNYERIEAQASQKIPLTSARLLNMQVGTGLYTRQYTNYFLDFEKFAVNNLPEGWDDEWTGDFQLLDSRLYNISKYYVSANVSYDTPLLFTSFIPYLGRYVERERLYWSGLIIEYNRPYYELGYGFTTSFFSLGLFSSFHDLKMQEFGLKFTVELFRRW